MKEMAKGIALLSLIALVGCAKQKDVVVARVGEREITAEDLEALASKSSSPIAIDKLLWTLIDREIMVLEAYGRGLDTDERIRSRLERIERTETTRLLKAKLREQIPIAEEEARRYYQEKGLASRQEVKARHIMVRTAEEAEEVLEALRDGADFAQLARERSSDKVSAVEGGDLGYWREGEVIGPTAQKVFSLEVGELSEPFRDPQGYYHVIEVLDKHPIGFEGLRLVAENRLKEQKLDGVYRGYMDDVKEQLHLRVEPEIADWLMERFRDLNGDLSGFSDAERRRIPIRYDDGEVQLGDYLIWLEALRPGSSRLADSSWVARSVERFTQDHILVPYAAHREGIDQSPSLQSYLKKQREQVMVTELRQQEVDRKVVTPERVQAYYESHKDRYYRPPRIVLRGVLLDSLRWAQEAYEKIRRGGDMAEVAREYPLFSGKYRNCDRFSFDLTEENKERVGAPLIELASKAEIDTINEPMKLPFMREGKLLTGYAIARILKREPARFEPLETPWVRREIGQKLRIEERSRIKELYEKWLIELRVTYNDRITIYQERLKLVDLPEPRDRPVSKTREKG